MGDSHLEKECFVLVKKASFNHLLKTLTLLVQIPRNNEEDSWQTIDIKKVTLRQKNVEANDYLEIISWDFELEDFEILVADVQFQDIKMNLKSLKPEINLDYLNANFILLLEITLGNDSKTFTSLEFFIEDISLGKRTIRPTALLNSPKKRPKAIPNIATIGVFQDQGSRKFMEDSHSVVIEQDVVEDLQSSLSISTNGLSLIIADGHSSSEASLFVKQFLWRNIRFLKDFKVDVKSAIEKGFKLTEDAFQKFSMEKDIDGVVGTTAAIALIQDDYLYVGNVGDSEVIVCKNGVAHLLTEKHTPNNPKEKLRIVQCGGRLFQGINGTVRLAHPVWNPQLINLGVSRTIGDYYFKDTQYISDHLSGLISKPSITEWPLTRDDQFLLMATDGFWDVFSYQEAADFVLSLLNKKECHSICKALVSHSKIKGSEDNITVILAIFSQTGYQSP